MHATDSTQHADDTPPAASGWLQLAGVTLAYGRKVVVSELSLSLSRGSIGCLLGPSGCGKTTVLRAIAGFEPVAAGAVCLGGRTLSDHSTQVPPEQRHIGMVFQDQALFPHLSVADNVGFGLRGKPGAAARVAQLLDTVHGSPCTPVPAWAHTPFSASATSECMG